MTKKSPEEQRICFQKCIVHLGLTIYTIEFVLILGKKIPHLGVIDVFSTRSHHFPRVIDTLPTQRLGTGHVLHPTSRMLHRYAWQPMVKMVGCKRGHELIET